MGMIIFLMAVIVEAAFAAFCIITKSNHTRERSIIRIASFIGFVLLAVLPIIDWSLRYYALASLLLLLAMNQAWWTLRQNRYASCLRFAHRRRQSASRAHRSQNDHSRRQSQTGCTAHQFAKRQTFDVSVHHVFLCRYHRLSMRSFLCLVSRQLTGRLSCPEISNALQAKSKQCLVHSTRLHFRSMMNYRAPSKQLFK